MTCPKCTCEDCVRALGDLTKKQRAIELRGRGMTLPRIAEAIGSSQPAVCKMLKEARTA